MRLAWKLPVLGDRPAIKARVWILNGCDIWQLTRTDSWGTACECIAERHRKRVAWVQMIVNISTLHIAYLIGRFLQVSINGRLRRGFIWLLRPRHWRCYRLDLRVLHRTKTWRRQRLIRWHAHAVVHGTSLEISRPFQTSRHAAVDLCFSFGINHVN